MQRTRLPHAEGTVAHRSKSQRVTYNNAKRYRTEQQRDQRHEGERRKAAEGAFKRRDDRNALRIRFRTTTPR